MRHLGGTPIQRVAEISWRTLRYLGVAETVGVVVVVLAGTVVVVAEVAVEAAPFL